MISAVVVFAVALASIGEPRAFDETERLVCCLVHEVTSKNTGMVKAVIVRDFKRYLQMQSVLRQTFPVGGRQIELAIARKMIVRRDHGKGTRGEFGKLHFNALITEQKIGSSEMPIHAGQMSVVPNANYANNSDFTRRVVLRLPHQLDAVKVKVGTKLLTGIRFGYFHQPLSSVGVSRGDSQSIVGVLSRLAGDANSFPRKVEVVPKTGYAECRRYELPKGPFCLIARRVGILPLYVKIAVLIASWVAAWGLVFRGFDGLDGWSRTKIDGALSVIGGLSLMVVGCLFLW